MLKIDFYQEAASEADRIDSAVLRAVEREVVERVPNVPSGTIAARLISDEEMTKLNERYRQKEGTTDVLSFSYLDDPEMETLGDVVISYEQAGRQQKHGMQYELVFLLVHGVLHVLGYDHEDPEDAQVMFPLQDAIIEKVI